jgi:hypothetical protein
VNRKSRTVTVPVYRQEPLAADVIHTKHPGTFKKGLPSRSRRLAVLETRIDRLSEAPVVMPDETWQAIQAIAKISGWRPSSRDGELNPKQGLELAACLKQRELTFLKEKKEVALENTILLLEKGLGLTISHKNGEEEVKSIRDKRAATRR